MAAATGARSRPITGGGVSGGNAGSCQPGKELRLAESRGTGIPRIFRTMADNGSPTPGFDFDEARSYFRVTLPAHPEYGALSALREYAYWDALVESRFQDALRDARSHSRDRGRGR